MTILATAPPICKMGPCQNTDKNLFYFKSLIPVFIAGNRISCLKRKLYYNYVSNWMSINSTLNFLLVDSHIQFTPFRPFSSDKNGKSLEWIVSFADCVLKDSISKNQMLLGEPMQTTSCKNSQNKKIYSSLQMTQ